MKGHYEIPTETFMSVPCTIGANEITSQIRLRITADERKQIKASAAKIHSVQKIIN